MAASKKSAPGAALKANVERVLGGWGSHSRFARGLEIENSTLHRIYAGDSGVPGYAVATIELLDALPPEQWPKRWR